MDITDIFDLTRELTHTTSTQAPNATLLTYFNPLRSEFYEELVNLDENYGYEERTALNLIADQVEYQLPVVTSTLHGISKIKKVSIKYNTNDTYHTEATERNISNLQRETDYYEDNQPTAQPFYIIADESIFIYPKLASTEDDVANGIKLYGIRDEKPVSLTSTEAEIAIPRAYHRILAYGLRPMVYHSRGQNQKALQAEQLYNSKKKVALQQL
jgi:hypothetical protein